MGNKTKIIIVIVIIVIAAIAINSLLGTNNSVNSINLGGNNIIVPANWTLDDDSVNNDYNMATFSGEESSLEIYIFNDTSNIEEKFNYQFRDSQEYSKKTLNLNGTTVYYMTTAISHPSTSYISQFKYMYMFEKNNKIYRITIYSNNIDVANKNNNYKDDVISIINSIN